MKYYIKAFKNYVNFEGRARRAEFWQYYGFNLLFMYTPIVVGMFTGFPELAYLGSVYALVQLLPTLAVGVRRMHDLDKSGWYILIPLYNLILFCTLGQKGSNQYGEDPKDEEINLDDFGKEEAITN